MGFEQREGSGSLFKNDKRGNDKAPDYRGTALLNGVTMEVAGWIKQGKQGSFMSLAIKPQQPRTSGREQTANPRSHGPDDDSPPF